MHFMIVSWNVYISVDFNMMIPYSRVIGMNIRAGNQFTVLQGWPVDDLIKFLRHQNGTVPFYGKSRQLHQLNEHWCGVAYPCTQREGNPLLWIQLFLWSFYLWRKNSFRLSDFDARDCWSIFTSMPRTVTLPISQWGARPKPAGHMPLNCLQTDIVLFYLSNFSFPSNHITLDPLCLYTT